MRRVSLFFSLMVIAVFALSGCKTLKLKVGLGYLVTNPKPGTPEEVLQQILKAGLQKDEELGWKMFKELIHSEERKNIVSMNEWKKWRYPRLRRQVKYYVIDPKKVSFKVMRIRELDNGKVEYFIKNKMSDMPTPCTFKPDEKAGGAWRIWKCSL